MGAERSLTWVTFLSLVPFVMSPSKAPRPLAAAAGGLLGKPPGGGGGGGGGPPDMPGGIGGGGGGGGGIMVALGTQDGQNVRARDGRPRAGARAGRDMDGTKSNGDVEYG